MRPDSLELAADKIARLCGEPRGVERHDQGIVRSAMLDSAGCAQGLLVAPRETELDQALETLERVAKRMGIPEPVNMPGRLDTHLGG